MQTQTSKNTKPTFKKVTVSEVETPKEKKGWEFTGRFVDIKKKPYQRLNTKSGEIEDKNFKQLILADDEGNAVAYACDTGLEEQINLAGISKGDLIKCINLGKKQLKEGRTLNIWDVFVAQTN